MGRISPKYILYFFSSFENIHANIYAKIKYRKITALCFRKHPSILESVSTHREAPSRQVNDHSLVKDCVSFTFLPTRM